MLGGREETTIVCIIIITIEAVVEFDRLDDLRRLIQVWHAITADISNQKNGEYSERPRPVRDTHMSLHIGQHLHNKAMGSVPAQGHVGILLCYCVECLFSNQQ
jgi:hypothetical protein